jgi:predicted membrane GTPase involved in stress response
MLARVPRRCEIAAISGIIIAIAGTATTNIGITIITPSSSTGTTTITIIATTVTEHACAAPHAPWTGAFATALQPSNKRTNTDTIGLAVSDL